MVAGPVHSENPSLNERYNTKLKILLSLPMPTWYAGAMPRSEATDLLMGEKEGVFLVRDTYDNDGDFVLSHKERSKVAHYLIKKVQTKGSQHRYQIGDQTFPDVPNLLAFYHLHYLDEHPLIRPFGCTELQLQCAASKL